MVLVRILRFFVICLIIAQLILPQRAAMPGWWTDDSGQTRIINAGATPSNFAPANLGQLKYVATQAKKYLDRELAAVGGAGSEINTLVGNFEPRAGQNYTAEQLTAFRAANYAPINLGQLKAVAKPFYQRLLSVGYKSRYNLLAHGAPAGWAYDYPWDPTQPWNQAGAGDKSVNYGVANIGQLKMAFSFDLTSDTDGNFLPGGLLGSTEGGMSNPNSAPGRQGNGGNTTSSPGYGTPNPGGGGAGPQIDPDHSASADIQPPTLSIGASSASADDPSATHFDWNLFGGPATQILIQWRIGSGDWATLQSVSASNTSADIDISLLANQSYLFRLQVTYSNGETLFSNVVSDSVPLVLGQTVWSSEVQVHNPAYSEYQIPGDPPVSDDPHYYRTVIEKSTLTSQGDNGTYNFKSTLTNPVTGAAILEGNSTETKTGLDGDSSTVSASIVDGVWVTVGNPTAVGPPFTGSFFLAPSMYWDIQSSTYQQYAPAASEGTSDFASEQLTDPYDPADFFKDVINAMPPYTLGQTSGAYRMRYIHNDYVGILALQYSVLLQPSLPTDIVFYDVFYPQTFDASIPALPPVVVGTHPIHVNQQVMASDIYTIDPGSQPDAFAPDGTVGGYVTVQGMQFSASGSINDPTSKSGIVYTPLDLNEQANGAGLLTPPTASGNGVTGGISFITTNAPGAIYTIQILNGGHFTVTGSDGVLSNGEQIATNVGPNSAYTIGVTANTTASSGEQVTIIVTEKVGDQTTSSTVKFTVSLGAGKDFTIPFDEASGSRYRKIALNGRPLSDEKPQQTAESDEEKEESYIDALTLGLQHSTTDVYVPVPGSDLALSVRRNNLSEVWNMKGGLRPHERLDRPFGAGWSSNVVAYEEVETTTDGDTTTSYTYIVDQNGARHRFALVGSTQNGVYVPLPSDSRENGDYLTTLSSNGEVFVDRYGTKLVFDLNNGITQKVSGSRDSGSGQTKSVFYRVSSITDRLQNTLNYNYPAGATTLIPETIVMGQGQGLAIYIQQDGAGHITNIWDPNGNQFSYGYSTQTYTYNNLNYAETVLTSVTGPDQTGGQTTKSITKYESTLSLEQDQTPGGITQGNPVPKFHIDLGKITDPSGNAYAFSYHFDDTRWNYNSRYGYYQETGAPSYVTQVALPDGSHATFSKGASRVALDTQVDAQGQMILDGASIREALVTDAGGNSIHYTWGGGQVFTVGGLASTGPPPKVVFYTSMKVDYGLGSESFTFDPTAGLALSSVTDFSGNTTSYTYGNHYTSPVGDLYSQVFPWAGFATAYPDPTIQTDALQHSKQFHYSTPYQIMDSVLDEEGRSKVYQLDTLGRRLVEYVVGADGVTVQQTNFGYDANFPGVVTTQTVKNLNGPGWASDLVTQKQLDPNGRVAQETVAPGTTDSAGFSLTTKYQYDLCGNKIKVTDPRQNVTGFEYDLRNRLTRVVYADGSAKTIDYYPNGLKWHETDENTHQTTFAYDTLNRVTSQTRTVTGGDIVTSYGYTDAVQPKTSVTDPNLHTTTFQYDGLLRLIKATDALGRFTQYDYSGPNSGAHAFDSAGFKPTTIMDPRGYVTTITYDALYRATAKQVQYQPGVSGVTSNTSTGYDNVGNPVTAIDPLQHTTTTRFDALNRPTLVTYADHTTTSAAYTATGLKWQVADELGQVTETQYDAAGRAVFVIAPSVDDGLNPEDIDRAGHSKQPTTQTVYDAAGNVSATINPLQQRWDYVYDVRNRKIEEHQPAVTNGESGQVVQPVIYTGYDYVGNVLWVQDARGFTTETIYDQANRPLTVTAPPVLLAGGTQPVRPTTTKTYDPGGNLLTITDANDHKTTNVYDQLNRLKTTTDAVPITITYDYDEVGNRTSVWDGLSQQTTFAYDGLNRNTTTTDAAGKVTTLAYDGLNKVSRTDALGQVTSYGYDARNRLTLVTYPARPVDNRVYGYDLTGHLQSVTEAGKNGLADVGYTYDNLHRVLTETSNGAIHSYHYDLAGNRLSVQYGLVGGGLGRLIVSAYDPLNRLRTLTEGARLTIYGYDLAGNVVAKNLPNGDAVTTHYDGLGRAYEEEGVSTHGVLYHYLSLCDAVGNLRISTEYTAGVAPRTVSMGYDNADRLISEVVIDVNNQPVSDTSYDYDTANNRQHKIANGVMATYNYNNLNQLSSWSDTAGNVASYGYDFNGNRVSRTVGGVSDIYSYDTENRLVSLTKNTVQASTTTGTYGYVYDYRTRRTTRTENGTTTQLVFSGGTSVQEYSSPGVVSAEYVRGSDWGGGVGGVLYSLRSGIPSFDHYDRRGDVTARTDGNGTVTWQASYEAFGTRPAEYGTTQDRQKANTKEEDPTGLLNEGMRYRDLETGTFITRDPAGFVDGPNLYAYVVQNPWTKFDPEGLFMFGLYDSASDYFRDIGRTFCGEGHAVGDVASGIVGNAMNPVQPVIGLAKVAMHPVDTAKAAGNAIQDTWNSGLEGQGRVAGHVIIAAGMAAVPAAEVSDVANAANAADKAGQLAEAANAEKAAPVPNVGPAEGSPGQSAKSLVVKKPNLNRNDAISNFGIYEIETPEGLEKVGKADLNRVTKSSGLPTRIHQQVRKLEKIHGTGNVKAKVVEELGETTTAAAKAAENARIKKIVDQTGKVPPGNESSYNP